MEEYVIVYQKAIGKRMERVEKKRESGGGEEEERRKREKGGEKVGKKLRGKREEIKWEREDYKMSVSNDKNSERIL